MCACRSLEILHDRRVRESLQDQDDDECVCVSPRTITMRITKFYLSTSEQVRLPAEFKHIIKRRKRN